MDSLAYRVTVAMSATLHICWPTQDLHLIQSASKRALRPSIAAAAREGLGERCGDTI